MTMTASPPVAPEAGALTHSDVRMIIVGVMLALFLAAIDQTIIATALPTIGRAFGSMEDLPWLATGYLLAATAVIPLYGKLSDIHGRRVMLLLGIVTFVLGSIVCALAPTMLVLILGRALQGLGGGGLIALANTIVADVVAPRERGRYQAYFATVYAGASVAGPVLGGFFAEHLHWSLIFWINLPLGLVSFLFCRSTLKRLPRHDRKHRLDVLGAVLLVAASVSAMLALSWGGVQFPWRSVEIVVLFAVAALLSIAFAVRIARAEEPLVPRTVLGNSVVMLGTGASAFGFAVMIGLTVFVPLYFELVAGLTASQSGLSLLPLTLGTVAGATFAGRLMVRVRHYLRAPIAGFSAAALLCLGLALFLPQVTLPVMLVALFVMSVGMGMQLPVTTVAVQNAVMAHEMGSATATIGFVRQIGGMLTVAAFGAIVLNAGSLATTGPAMLDPSAAEPAFRWVFLVSAGIFVAAALLLVMMEERPLRTTLSPATRSDRS